MGTLHSNRTSRVRLQCKEPPNLPLSLSGLKVLDFRVGMKCFGCQEVVHLNGRMRVKLAHSLEALLADWPATTDPQEAERGSQGRIEAKLTSADGSSAYEQPVTLDCDTPASC
jgi:hypothetical protein